MALFLQIVLAVVIFSKFFRWCVLLLYFGAGHLIVEANAYS